MLAQNFKEPKALKISDEEFVALVSVLGMLERSELTHRPALDPHGDDGFNMGTVGSKTSCGTVACIGGWVAFLNGKSLYEAVQYVYRAHGRLKNLFYPPERFDYDDITTEQAAMAIRNFLTTGAPRWTDVMSD